MIEIVPAILEKKFSGIKKKVNSAEKAGVNLVQIDICDGKLTPSKTFASSAMISSFEKIQNISDGMNYELDMIVDMESRVGEAGNKFLSVIDFLEPKKVIFHFSGVSDWEKIFQNFKGAKTKLALGIWLSDDVKKVNSVIEKYPFDYIQIMGIEKVGYGGQGISNRVYAKSTYFSEKYPNLPVQIDGGVKLQNTHKLALHGVTGFVAGSGIYAADDVVERIKDFKKEAKV